MLVSFWILLGMLAGIALGLLAPAWALKIKFLGDIFLGALKMMISPLIFTSVLVAVISLNLNYLKRLSLRTFGLFFMTTSLAILTGLVFVHLMEPGKGTALALNYSAPAVVPEISAGKFAQQLIADLFQNPIQAMAQLNVLSIIVFSLLLGLAISTLPQKKALVQGFTQLNAAILKIIQWIMVLAPAGVLALMANLMAQAGPGIFLSAGKFIITVIASTAFHFFVTYSLIVWLLAKWSPWEFFKKSSPALLVAFSTSSSNATLPVTLATVKNNLRVPPKIANFVLPLGATLNMDGTALYEAVAALFIAQLYGIPLSLLQEMIIVITAMLASVGAAGIPSAGMVTMIMVLQSVGLPIEPIALLLSFDRFLDTFRTSMNVAGDMLVSTVLAHQERRQ